MHVNLIDSNILYTSTITGFLSATFLSAEYKKTTRNYYLLVMQRTVLLEINNFSMNKYKRI